ncbi:MAG TPA: hypothetical protein VF862_09885 [Gemmatimonadales bacterium]
MGLRWSQRLILAAVAAALCLVPIIGSLAHGHAHHEAQEAHAHVADAVRAPAGRSVAATHDGEDHPHLPTVEATVSRVGSDWIVAPVTTAIRVTLVTHTTSAAAPSPDDPRPPRTHDPPAAPRAPPIA